jgi:hypothetical protein
MLGFFISETVAEADATQITQVKLLCFTCVDFP